MPELTKEEYEEFKQLIKDKKITNFLLQEINDTLEGRILPNNIHDNAITTRHIQAEAITDEEIEDAAIIASKIAADAVTAIKIATSAIDATKFADTIKPIEVVDTLPEAGTQGRTVFLTTDNKLYRDTGIAWTVAVVGTDITANTIEAGQIKAGAIGTDQLAANAVTAAKIAANTITASQIYAGAIGTDQLAALAITADKIAASAITTVKLDALAVTADKIAAATITANKYSELRNTYVHCGADSLDSTHPFILDFEIVSEMTAIQSVKLSFKLSKFRAYETGAASGGGHTSGSGGGQTSGAGGDETTATTNEDYIALVPLNSLVSHEGGYYLSGNTRGMVTGQYHVHAQPHHHHSVAAHDHSVADHAHGITYGIYEPTTTPTVHYHISNDGVNFGAASANYNTNQLDLVIAGISAAGFKAIRFDSDVLCRVSVWIMVKVDITA